MSWTVFRLVFRLESPLHMGWRKAGNLQQTRRYVTGRAWWGCCTSSLARVLDSSDYAGLGNLVRDHLLFGYFYPATTVDEPLLPRWENGHLHFGGWRMDEFDSRFLSSLASTAIDRRVGSAEEGSLHEVEYLASSSIGGEPVLLVGHLFARECDVLSVSDGDLVVCGRRLFAEVLPVAQIGGEQRYGFGRLLLERGETRQVEDVFGLPIDAGGPRPRVNVPEGRSLLAHTRVDGLEATGDVEPLVSREWDEEHGPGRRTRLLAVCYAPGAVTHANVTLSVGAFGIWESGDLGA